MAPSKIITIEELAKIMGCPSYRVSNWIEQQPEGLIVEKNGKKGLDPVMLAMFLKQQS